MSCFIFLAKTAAMRSRFGGPPQWAPESEGPSGALIALIGRGNNPKVERVHGINADVAKHVVTNRMLREAEERKSVFRRISDAVKKRQSTPRYQARHNMPILHPTKSRRTRRGGGRYADIRIPRLTGHQKAALGLLAALSAAGVGAAAWHGGRPEHERLSITKER